MRILAIMTPFALALAWAVWPAVERAVQRRIEQWEKRKP